MTATYVASYVYTNDNDNEISIFGEFQDWLFSKL